MLGCVGRSTKKKRKTILLCYACLAWLVSVCYALAGFTLWRLAASAHNVSLYRVRQHEDVRREGAIGKERRREDKEQKMEGRSYRKLG